MLTDRSTQSTAVLAHLAVCAFMAGQTYEGGKTTHEAECHPGKRDSNWLSSVIFDAERTTSDWGGCQPCQGPISLPRILHFRCPYHAFDSSPGDIKGT